MAGPFSPLPAPKHETRAAPRRPGVDLVPSWSARLLIITSGFLDEDRPFLELHRRGEPDEVAAVVAFLCSDLASFVKGSNYRVDAGSVATV